MSREGTIAGRTLVALAFAALVAATIYIATMPEAKETVREWRERELQATADRIWTLAATLEAMAREGVISRRQAQARVVAYARRLRFGPRTRDYCWINDLEGRVVMHPHWPGLEGVVPERLSLPGRDNPFRQAAAKAAAAGRGWITYRWPRPGAGKEATPKKSFVKAFAPWGWVIGLGLFARDLEEDFADLARITHQVSLAALGLILGLAALALHRLRRYARQQPDSRSRLRSHRQRLRLLASQLSLAGARERRQIAVELHDRIGQNLALAKINLGSGREQAPAPWDGRLAQVRELLEESIRETRSLTFEISPPVLYEVGLAAALEQLADHFSRRQGTPIAFHDDGGEKPLAPDLKVLLYQCGRELLVNALKHARAGAIRVACRRAGPCLELVVADDGVGFDPRSVDANWRREGGFGLFSLKVRLAELGGRLAIDSAPGRGTRITATAPLAPAVQEKEHEEAYTACG